jgi:hypothetical protein
MTIRPHIIALLVDDRGRIGARSENLGAARKIADDGLRAPGLRN